MAFKEVSVVQVKEVLRRWLRGDEGLRRVADGAGVDRKTAQRYVDAAQALGARRDGGEHQLTDQLVAAVVQAVQPGRRSGRGESWAALESHHDFIKDLIDKGVTAVKVGDLLARRGVVVPERTLHRYCAERCRDQSASTTVRLADPEPGREAQTDFGRMGLIYDPASSRRRVVHALILVAVWSRHMFVWLSFTQTTADVIEGFEHAWEFFHGVFPIIIPDNLTPVITKAEPTEPRINDTFLEYSQDRGFLIDAARVRHPKDKDLSSHCASLVVCDGYRFRAVLCAWWPAVRFVRDDVGHLEVVLAFVVELLGNETAFPAPGLDRAGAQPSAGGELLQAHEPPCLEPLPARFEAVVTADMVHHKRVEGLVGARQDAFAVELGSDTRFGVAIEEVVNFSHYRSRGPADVVGGHADRYFKLRGRAGLEPYLGGDQPVLPSQRHVFDQQPDHALALTLGCAGVRPQGREVRGQG